MITNSKRPSRLGVFAIENDRDSSVPGTMKSRYWPGKNLISSGSMSFTHQVPHVVGDRLVRDDLGDALLQRQPVADDLLVVVEELDHQILVGVRPAEQGRPSSFS